MAQWGHWWAKADAAEVFGEDFKNATGTLGRVSRAGRLAGGPIAIAGDVSTLVDPPQSGAAGMTDRVMAGTNGVVVAGDTARALGAALGVKALANLSLGPVGVGIAVDTGLYLADAYAYRHWTWFRQDLAQPVGHASGRGGPGRDGSHAAKQCGGTARRPGGQGLGPHRRQRRQTEVARDRGRRLLDSMPYPENLDHHFVVDPTKFDYYAMDLASEVIQASTDFDGKERAPMRLAEARITLGVVAARQGDLDEAVSRGEHALSSQRRSLPSLLMASRDLTKLLNERYPGEAGTRQYLDQLHALSAGHKHPS